MTTSLFAAYEPPCTVMSTPRLLPETTPRNWFQPQVAIRDYTLSPLTLRPHVCVVWHGTDDVLEGRIAKALSKDGLDWRTPETIGRELNVPSLSVGEKLENMSARGIVRRPYGDRPDEAGMFRLTSRSYTLGERLRQWRDLFSRG